MRVVMVQLRRWRLRLLRRGGQGGRGGGGVRRGQRRLRQQGDMRGDDGILKSERTEYDIWIYRYMLTSIVEI